MNRSKIKPLIGSAVIIFALFTVIFSGSYNFSEEMAENIIAEIGENLSIESANSGNESRLKYSNIKINGFAYDKSANISDLVLNFLYNPWQNDRQLVISTTNADLIPDVAGKNRARLILKQPINLITGNELTAILQPENPITYSVNFRDYFSNADDAEIGNNNKSVLHQISANSGITITRLNPKREARIDFSKGFILENSLSKSKREAHARISANGTVLESEGATINIRSANLIYDVKHKGSDIYESSNTLTLDQISFSGKNGKASPFTAVASWTMKEQKNISGGIDNRKLSLDNILINNGISKVSINGNLETNNENFINGEIIVEISEPDEFLRSDWIIPEKKEQVRELLDKIVGNPVSSHKQAIITISRQKNDQNNEQKNSEWQIGKMPLSELLKYDLLGLFIFGEKTDHEEKQSAE